MRYSILLIMVHAFGSCKSQDNTSSAHCRLSPCTSVVGQPSWIQFLLSSDPKLEEKDLYVSKRTNGTSKHEVPNKEDFILEGIYNRTKKDLDFYVRTGYSYIWNSAELTLTVFIEKVGPQHEGAYVAEYSNNKFHCRLEVLAAPPSTQAPDTSTDGVKDSGAADEHKEESKFCQKAFWGLIAITLVIVGLVVAYWIKQKMSAASRKKTGKGETSQDDSSGQDDTTDGCDASGMPSGDTNLQLRGGRKQRADQQSSGEGCNSSSKDADSCEVEIATDDAISDHRAGDHATEGQHKASSSSMLLLGGKRAQGATPRTMQSYNSRGYSRHRLRFHNSSYSTVRQERINSDDVKIENEEKALIHS